MKHKASVIFLLPIFLCAGATMHAGKICGSSRMIFIRAGKRDVLR